MELLNYHHLMYFWVAARDGGITAASRTLDLAPSTISAQIRQLEERLGHALFRRDGRSLVLTDVGQTVFGYADEIFALGREMSQTLAESPLQRTTRLVVGVADVMPRMLAMRLVRPALDGDTDVRLTCRTGSPDDLIEQMVLHRVHLVLTDAPATDIGGTALVSHLVGRCGIVLFATPELAARFRNPMSRALDGAPFLLPGEHTRMRQAVEEWFVARKVRPRLIAEFDDSALMKVFGQHGHGIFPGPALVAREIAQDFGVVPIGRLDGAEERVYAHTLERKTAHPLVDALIEGARLAFVGGARGDAGA